MPELPESPLKEINLMGRLRGVPTPLTSLPPLLVKERGTKGVR